MSLAGRLQATSLDFYGTLAQLGGTSLDFYGTLARLEASSLDFYGTLAQLEASSLDFYGTLAQLEASSLDFYGTLAHLETAWRGSKTVPGSQETKKAHFEQNSNLKTSFRSSPPETRNLAMRTGLRNQCPWQAAYRHHLRVL